MEGMWGDGGMEKGRGRKRKSEPVEEIVSEGVGGRGAG